MSSPTLKKIGFVLMLTFISFFIATPLALAQGEERDEPKDVHTENREAHPEEQKAEPEDHAVNFNFLYSGEVWVNTTGGDKRGAEAIHNIDASIAVDGEKAFGLKGSNFLIDGFYNSGKSIDRLVSAGQSVSPFDTGGVEMFRLYQAWYNQKFWGDRTEVLLGVYDLNTEFDAFGTAGLFFNSGYGFDTTLDQTGLNGASTFPNTSLAVRVKQKITDEFSVLGAVLDGVPDDPNHPEATAFNLSDRDGALVVGEVDYTPTEDTKVMAGYWRYLATFDDLVRTDADGNPEQVRDNQGFYVGGATRLYTQKEKRGLDGFLRFGFANGDVNQFDRAINAGVVYTGLFDGREEDQMGFAVNNAHNSQPYKDSQTAAGNAVDDSETNVEFTYRAPLNDWVTLRPNAQYIINPATNPAYENAFVVGLRLEIGHSFGIYK
jgi:porin